MERRPIGQTVVSMAVDRIPHARYDRTMPTVTAIFTPRRLIRGTDDMMNFPRAHDNVRRHPIHLIGTTNNVP